MRPNRNFLVYVVTVAIALAMATEHSVAQKLQYPHTKKVDHVDTYFGVKVADPYRWLEDENSPATKEWVEAENKVTFGYLEKIPFREQVKRRLERLYDYPKYSAPFKKGEYFYFSKNEGLQNQSVLCRQKGLDGSPEIVLDPNSFSADGTTRLSGFSLSKDGKLAAYGISRAGSDWREVYVMDMSSLGTLTDTLLWIKASGTAWRGKRFYYSRYPAPEKGKELTTKNVFHTVYYHRVGTPQSQDELVYEDKAHPERFHNVSTTEDERFAILSISERGTGKKGNALFFLDLSKNDKTFRPIIAEIGDDNYGVIDDIGDKFLIRTNRKAPNGRVILFDPSDPDEKHWKEALPEKPEPLQGAGGTASLGRTGDNSRSRGSNRT